MASTTASTTTVAEVADAVESRHQPDPAAPVLNFCSIAETASEKAQLAADTAEQVLSLLNRLTETCREHAAGHRQANAGAARAAAIATAPLVSKAAEQAASFSTHAQNAAESAIMAAHLSYPKQPILHPDRISRALDNADQAAEHHARAAKAHQTSQTAINWLIAH